MMSQRKNHYYDIVYFLMSKYSKNALWPPPVFLEYPESVVGESAQSALTLLEARNSRILTSAFVFIKAANEIESGWLGGIVDLEQSHDGMELSGPTFTLETSQLLGNGDKNMSKMCTTIVGDWSVEDQSIYKRLPELHYTIDGILLPEEYAAGQQPIDGAMSDSQNRLDPYNIIGALYGFIVLMRFASGSAVEMPVLAGSA